MIFVLRNEPDSGDSFAFCCNKNWCIHAAMLQIDFTNWYGKGNVHLIQILHFEVPVTTR